MTETIMTATPINSPWRFSGKIIRWVDGDTVYLEFVKTFEVEQDFGFGFKEKIQATKIFRPQSPVRLYGIDTPEKNSSDPSERAKAIAAQRRANELLPPGTLVEVWSHKNDVDVDKYGRYLVEISIPGVIGYTINRLLVEEELAKIYFGGKKE